MAQFYRALNGRDIALMERNWDNTDQAAMDNPLGGIKRGWAEIKPVYERLFRVDGDYHFEFYDYTLHQFADIFYVVGIERGHVSIRGANLDMKIRTTRVFRFDARVGARCITMAPLKIRSFSSIIRILCAKVRCGMHSGQGLRIRFRTVQAQFATSPVILGVSCYLPAAVYALDTLRRDQ